MFDKDTPVPIPTRIAASELPKIDLIQDIIRPKDQKKKEPVVELSSDKSGLTLAFSTNRMLLHSF